MSHLSGALLCSLTGIKLIHVPYKGGAPALNDVVGGHIQCCSDTSAKRHPAQGGPRARARGDDEAALARRARSADDAGSGVPGYEVAGWYGVLAPAKTPRPIIDKLNNEIVRILHSPDVQGRLAADGSEAVGSTPEQFGAHIKSEVAKWAKVVKEANIRID